MDFSADHIGFVAVAYGLTFAVLAGLIVMVVFDLRARRRELAELESAGGGKRRRAAAREKAQAT